MSNENKPDFSENQNNHTGRLDDPRLTACALGEMDMDERAAFEAAIRDDAAAQTALAEIRALAGELRQALAREAMPGGEPGAAASPPSDARRCAQTQTSGTVVPSGGAADVDEVARERERRREREDDPYRRRMWRFPYFLVAGLAAACFAVFFFAHVLPQQRQQQAGRIVAVEFDRRDAEKPSVSAPVSLPEAPSPITSPGMQTDRLKNAAAVGDSHVIGGNFNGGIIATDSFIDTDDAAATGDAARLAAIRGEVARRNRPAATDGVKRFAAPRGEVARRRAQRAAAAGITTSGVPAQPFNTESYAHQPDSRFTRVADAPVSTFAADVDTASYTNIRRFLDGGRLPPPDAVHIEELVNYFPYDYAPPPRDGTAPFAATLETAAAPWNPAHRLVRIGIKGRELDAATRPPASLVFLLDVSGSMDAPNKLPLVKDAMRLLLGTLRADDRVAIVTYAGASGLALPSTPAAKKRDILAALDALRAQGSTNGAMGIQLAYDIAKANFLPGGANRVILCTDGDFNIGVTNDGDLARLIEEKARTGVFLTVLGFGMGNYKNAKLELLANKGNGQHGYIDTRAEARRMLVEQSGATLFTIAKDVKLQVEFNPAAAQSYRLIGYENRRLAREDFNNDQVDAGEIGAGHTVTALYEVVPLSADTGALAGVNTGVNTAAATLAPPADPLKYQPAPPPPALFKPELAGELLTLKIRFKAPTADQSEMLEFTLENPARAFAEASRDFKFATSVAAFGMVLRDSPDKAGADYDQVLDWAESGLGPDADGRRHEFLNLVRRAKELAVN
jgi:Ca-activated chloride channel family protein